MITFIGQYTNTFIRSELQYWNFNAKGWKWIRSGPEWKITWQVHTLSTIEIDWTKNGSRLELKQKWTRSRLEVDWKQTNKGWSGIYQTFTGMLLDWNWSLKLTRARLLLLEQKNISKFVYVCSSLYKHFQMQEKIMQISKM